LLFVVCWCWWCCGWFGVVGVGVVVVCWLFVVVGKYGMVLVTVGVFVVGCLCVGVWFD
jgi:hypothetical protein